MTLLSIATSERWGAEEKTEWHRVVMFEKLADIANRFLKKGDTVYIEGKIVTRSWEDQKGAKRYMTEVVANTMEKLFSPKRGEGQGEYLSVPAEQPDHHQQDSPFEGTGQGTKGPADALSGGAAPAVAPKPPASAAAPKAAAPAAAPKAAAPAAAPKVATPAAAPKVATPAAAPAAAPKAAAPAATPKAAAPAATPKVPAAAAAPAAAPKAAAPKPQAPAQQGQATQRPPEDLDPLPSDDDFPTDADLPTDDDVPF